MKALDIVLDSPQELQDTCKLYDENYNTTLHGMEERFPVLSSLQVHCPEQGSKLSWAPSWLLPRE